MNIFYLHESPIICARMMSNKHVIKMIIESAQLLSTAHRVLDGREEIILSKNNRRLKRWVVDGKMNELLYKSTHVNHPSAIWVREAEGNYKWLYVHFLALCKQYRERYNKTHLSYKKMINVLNNSPKNIPNISETEIKLAITNKDYIVENNPMQSYRNYYEAEKLFTAEDRKRYFDVLRKN